LNSLGKDGKLSSSLCNLGELLDTLVVEFLSLGNFFVAGHSSCNLSGKPTGTNLMIILVNQRVDNSSNNVFYFLKVKNVAYLKLDSTETVLLELIMLHPWMSDAITQLNFLCQHLQLKQ
jgi:hypothetical protein